MFRALITRVRFVPVVGLAVYASTKSFQSQWNVNFSQNPSWPLSRSFFAICEESVNNDETDQENMEDELIMVPDVPEGEEEEWIAEKEKCSFCKHFMLSPCREEFKKWTKCVDLAKSKELDFVKSCTHYTRALMDCTTDHSEYFSATRPDEGDDIDEEGEGEAAGEGEDRGESDKQSATETSEESKN